MQSHPRHQAETLFHAARERAAGAERQAFLDGACGDDAELRSRVDVLLAAHEEASQFLEGQAVEGAREATGSSIGPYKLLQEIGEGGMGVVYMAEQETPVRRKVALKVIKLGMDTKQVIARFEAERQALALMDHPHIARVLDAGATDSGRPYFVMELVRGVPIDEYCDTHQLSTEERLELFVEVCRAVQHAHQKGIIHRDLKPTNVLITSHDGRPVPKIIDFGVAKATNQKLTERTLFTEFHQIIGTPEYMSPEQAEMSGLDVDTRSDIYALGVLLYKLLTGTTPVDPADLRTAGFEEMTRMIREDEPPVPSTRISKLGADGDEIARRRSSDAGTLSRHFRGDLDWIVMKALEKDRTRRYETASAFAVDVVRHMESRPVEAGPPGTLYRMRKFATRNRSAVLVGLCLLAILGLGLAGTLTGFVRARAEARRSGEISASLQDVLSTAAGSTFESGAQGRAELERILADVRELFGNEHATHAAVLDTLAQRTYDAGDFETAGELSAESLEVWKRVVGEAHPNVARTLARLGASQRARGEEEAAERSLREALALVRRSGDAARTSSAGYQALDELATLLGNRGDYTEADALLAELLEGLRASPSPSRFRILEILERRLTYELNRPDGDARELLAELVEEARAFYPDDSPMIAVWVMSYAKQLVQHGETAKAEPYLREAIARFQASSNPGGVYLFAASDALFQILRARTDPESVAEANELLGSVIQHGRTFWTAEEQSINLRFYAGRLLEAERHAPAVDAMLQAHQVLVDAGHSSRERENLRDSLTMLAFQIATRPGLEPEAYRRALGAVRVALEDEPEHPAMLLTLGSLQYRLGEVDEAAKTLTRLDAPLRGSRSSFARKLAPADAAFWALIHAERNDFEAARKDLARMRETLADFGAAGRGRVLLQEVEARLQDTPSRGDG